MSTDTDAETTDTEGQGDVDQYLARNAEEVEFDEIKDTDSWERAKTSGRDAVVVDRDDEGLGRKAVVLPDGEPHETLLVKSPDDTYAAACDCDGFRYNGYCAHVATLRMDEGLGQRDVPTSSEYVGVLVGAPNDADTAEAEPDPAPVEPAETTQTPAQPRRDDAFAQPLPDVEEQYVMEMDGETYIRKAGYARLLKAAGLRAVPSVVEFPNEGDELRAVAKGVIKDEDGEIVAQNWGSAGPPEAEDMTGAEHNLLELAITRAWTRAAAMATGEGLTAVAEVAPGRDG